MISCCAAGCFRTKIVKISFKRNQFFVQIRKESVSDSISVCLAVFLRICRIFGSVIYAAIFMAKNGVVGVCHCLDNFKMLRADFSVKF